MPQQRFRAVDLSFDALFGLVEVFLSLFGKRLLGERFGVVQLSALFLEQLLLLFHVPEIEHFPTRKDLFRADQGEKALAEEQGGKPGMSFVEKGLLAQDGILVALHDGI